MRLSQGFAGLREARDNLDRVRLTSSDRRGQARGECDREKCNKQASQCDVHLADPWCMAWRVTSLREFARWLRCRLAAILLSETATCKPRRGGACPTGRCSLQLAREMAMTGPPQRDDVLVSTAWVADHLDDPKVRLVDCRYYFDGRVGRDEYEKDHLPGAVYLDWSSELSERERPL